MDDDDYNALFDDVTRDFVQEAPARPEDSENERALHNSNIPRHSGNPDAAFELDLRRRRSLLEPENDPLDWHMRVECSLDEAAAKRRKLEADEHCLARLVQRIAEARSRRIGGLASDVVEDEDQPIAVGGDGETKKTNLRRFPPTDGSSWMPVSSTGSRQRFYLITKCDPDVRWELVGRSEAKQSRQIRRNRLTGRNFGDLLQEAVELMERTNDDVAVDSSERSMMDETDANNKGCELWVEKYRPKLFTDLLSDDGINRLLLTWLKLWDECVFKRKIVKPSADHSKNHPDKAGGKKNSKHPQKFEAANELSYELDQYKRPQYKVALLCGPPGLGKTTLAHVIAKHAGYNAVEMNASDDRTLERFENCIEGAVQATRTLDAQPRPNCLIIDEIDGAPAPSINYLVSIVRGTVVKHKRKTILRRPIIAICNDLYAPALRELRKVALVLQFPVTSPLRLAERLSVVSKWEHVQVDKQALEFLCDKSNQDIRCCLNALQFAAGFGSPTSSALSKRIGLLDVQKVSMGQKDGQKSLLDVWRAVFEIPRNTSRFDLICDSLVEYLLSCCSKRSLADGEQTMTLSARCARVAQIARAAGDDEKVRMGIFENYLLMKPVDGRIDSDFFGMEWFVYVDELMTLIGRTQSYEVMRYTSSLPIAFHTLFASNHHVNIAFPQAYQQVKQKTQRHQDTLASVIDGRTPDEDGGVASSAASKLRSTLNVTALNLDTLPFVTVIIQPTLRPVNSQLYSARELAVLKQVVDAMLNFALTYRQQRNTDGNYEYVLEPPIEHLTVYPLETPIGRNTLAYSARQMIAREVELERMRRSEPASKAVDTPAADNSSTSVKTVVTSQQQRNTSRSNALEQSTLSTMFGHRPKEPIASIFTAAVWFRFNEGYSNAIRRNIRMRDLLL